MITFADVLVDLLGGENPQQITFQTGCLKFRRGKSLTGELYERGCWVDGLARVHLSAPPDEAKIPIVEGEGTPLSWKQARPYLLFESIDRGCYAISYYYQSLFIIEGHSKNWNFKTVAGDSSRERPREPILRLVMERRSIRKPEKREHVLIRPYPTLGNTSMLDRF